MIIHPWPHIIVDDFFSDEDYQRIRQECIDFDNNVAKPAAVANENTKGHYRQRYTVDPFEKYDVPGYFNRFTEMRKHGKLGKTVQIIKMCRNNIFPVHNDVPHKTFSLIVYIHPEENGGTRLYNKDQTFIREIEWKPNRAVMFCPIDGYTYHDYTSTTDRFTLMLNYIDMDIKPENARPL